MIIQNNSSTRTYTVGGVTIDPGKQATVSDEYYDDIQGITDLQLIGVPPVNTAAMTRRSTQTLYNSDGTVYGIVSSDGIVSVTGRINPFTVGTGQSYSFAMKEGDVLTLTGNSTAAGVLTRTGAPNTVIGAGVAKIGPFSGVQMMNLATSAGSIDATVGDAALIKQPVALQGAGMILGVAGDSWSASHVLVSGNDTGFQPHCWLSWLQVLSFQRVQIAYNAAVGGTGYLQSPGFLQNCDAQLTAMMADPSYALLNGVVLEFGINDSKFDPDLVLAEAERQTKRIQGKKVFLCTIPPCGINPAGGYNFNQEPCAWDTSGTPVKRWEYVQRMNRGLALIAERSGGTVEIIDLHAALCDSASQSDMLPASYTSDGIHLVNVGAYRVGKAVVASWSRYIGGPVNWITSNGDYAGLTLGIRKSLNAAKNPMFTNGAVGANDWTTGNGNGASNSVSLIASPSGYGQAEQLVTTFSATVDSFGYTRSTSGHTFLSPGDTVYAQMYIKVTSPNHLKNINVQLRLNIDGVLKTYQCMMKGIALNDQDLPEGFEAVFRTPLAAIPASATTISVADVSEFHYGSAVGGVTVAVGHGEINRRPAGIWP